MELESAILDAAWQQLTEHGYADFTFESVAARAGTSRPVLYRRWPDRAELLIAAIRHAGDLAPIVLPDTGNLRDDVVTLMRTFNRSRARFVAVLSAQLAEYFRETGTSLADLRDILRGDRRSGMEQLLERAAERGEVDVSKVTGRVTELPMTLMRHELVMTMRSVPEAAIEEIVDGIWFPLLRARGALLRSRPPR